MHTYRDALRVRAAISLYPGDVPIFYPAHNSAVGLAPTDEPFTPDAALQALLQSSVTGVGALPLNPRTFNG
jgi:hypothetical protein